jgi:hypothetical protein
MRTKRLIAVVLLGGVLVGASGYLLWRGSTSWQIDKCLDHGGCWVYGEERCEQTDQDACDRSVEAKNAR